MRYDVETAGRLRPVTINRTGDSFAIRVDGRLHRVDAAPIDGHTLSLIVDSSVAAGPQDAPDTRRSGPGPGSVYETTITPETGGRVVVLVGAVPVTVTLNGRRARGKRGEAAAGSGPLRIAAPMPGKVVRVLVKTGDAVHARQPVVVVEAMKMENELRAEREGAVAEIHVREGMSVEAGALLIVIK